MTDDKLAHPYWTLPDLGGDTVGIDSTYTVFAGDCQRKTTDQRQFAKVLARLGPDHFVTLAGPARVTRARFLADRCEDAAEYTLPEASSPTKLGVMTSRSDTAAVTVYARLRAAAPTQLQADDPASVCGDCAFAAPSCAEQPAGTSIPVTGTFYLRVTFPAALTLSPDATLSLSP